MPRRDHGQASRHGFLGAVALAGTGLALGAAVDRASAAPALQATPDVAEIGRAEASAWSLTLFAYQDPYPGQIQQPATPPAGTRYVAAEVAVDNASDQPLNFSPAEIRLRDAAGTEYRGGTAVGTEPFLSVRNLNGGERSRGWVWFTVPADADLVELVYVGPPPVFRVTLT